MAHPSMTCQARVLPRATFHARPPRPNKRGPMEDSGIAPPGGSRGSRGPPSKAADSSVASTPSHPALSTTPARDRLQSGVHFQLEKSRSKCGMARRPTTWHAPSTGRARATRTYPEAATPSPLRHPKPRARMDMAASARRRRQPTHWSRGVRDSQPDPRRTRSPRRRWSPCEGRGQARVAAQNAPPCMDSLTMAGKGPPAPTERGSRHRGPVCWASTRPGTLGRWTWPPSLASAIHTTRRLTRPRQDTLLAKRVSRRRRRVPLDHTRT